MALTYTWNEALGIAKPYVKDIPTSTIDIRVCDEVNSIIWRYFPWRWAQFSLTSASGALDLVDGTQDYAVGTTTGGGYYKLLRARITRTDVSPLETKEFTNLANWLAPNVSQESDPMAMESIAFEPVASQFRLNAAASISGSATYRIDGEYWCQPLKITSTATVITFPDQYLEVAVEGLKWKYYMLGDDPRATTQYAMFQQKLKEMAEAEDFGGEDTRFPSETLGASGNVSSGSWFY